MSARHQSRSITPEELQAMQKDLDKSLGKDGTEMDRPEPPFRAHCSACMVMPDGSTVGTIPGTNMPVDASQTTAALNKATSRPAQGTVKAYESYDQMLSDMRDNRYGKDRAFTHAVEAKAAISNF